MDTILIKQYLERFEFEEPTEEVKQILNAPTSKIEVQKAINYLKGVKLWDQMDSLQFYKVFKNEITESLYDLMNDIIKTKELPYTWKEANISLLPKEGSDRKEPKNYRPSSSLNTD